MKITVEFDSETDGAEYIQRVMKVHDAFGALDDITQWLRTENKHGTGTLDAEKAYDKLWSILRERGMDPFED